MYQRAPEPEGHVPLQHHVLNAVMLSALPMMLPTFLEPAVRFDNFQLNASWRKVHRRILQNRATTPKPLGYGAPIPTSDVGIK